MSITYLRLFAGQDGESHFEEGTLETALVEFAPPAPPVHVSSLQPTSFGVLELPVGWFGDWHPVPARQWMCVLSGVVELRASDGELRRMGPGQLLLVEDTHGKGHTTRVIGEEAWICSVAQIK